MRTHRQKILHLRQQSCWELLYALLRIVVYRVWVGRPPVGGVGWLLVSLAVREAARRDAPVKAGVGVRYFRGGRRALPTAPLKPLIPYAAALIRAMFPALERLQVAASRVGDCPDAS